MDFDNDRNRAVTAPGESSTPRDVRLEPFGDVGAQADRDASGRFTRGNRAALVVGQDSIKFWQQQATARRELEFGIMADLGYSAEDAPRAVKLAVSAIGQAALIQASAFERLVESGGPLTERGRTRRAFAVWLQASGRLERALRLVGLERRSKQVDLALALSGLDGADLR
jgi:hypothetical protein